MKKLTITVNKKDLDLILTKIDSTFNKNIELNLIVIDSIKSSNNLKFPDLLSWQTKQMLDKVEPFLKQKLYENKKTSRVNYKLKFYINAYLYKIQNNLSWKDLSGYELNYSTIERVIRKIKQDKEMKSAIESIINTELR